MSNKRQITDTDEEQIAILALYGEVTLGIDEMTQISMCSIHGGGPWTYVGYGADYDLGTGPDAISAVEETYLALEQVLWNAVCRDSS